MSCLWEADEGESWNKKDDFLLWVSLPPHYRCSELCRFPQLIKRSSDNLQDINDIRHYIFQNFWMLNDCNGRLEVYPILIPSYQ